MLKPVYCSVLEVDVRVVTTEHATHFYDMNEVPVRVYTDRDEWEVCTLNKWSKNNKQFLILIAYKQTAKSCGLCC